MKRDTMEHLLSETDTIISVVKYGADKGDERLVALTSDHPNQARLLDYNEYEILRAFNMAMLVHESFLTDEERNTVFEAWKART